MTEESHHDTSTPPAPAPAPEEQGDGRSTGMWIGLWTIAMVVLGVVMLIALRPFQHPRSMSYLGPQACQECHPEQFASWSKTRMAQSFDALRPGTFTKAKEIAGLDPDADYTDDPSCLPCHTTGYGLVGGFVSAAQTPNMAGVTCEACHGPGGRYAGTVMDVKDPSFATSDAVAVGLIYPPTKRVCIRCHNDESPFVGMEYTFDYEPRVAAGTHRHVQLRYEHVGDRP